MINESVENLLKLVLKEAKELDIQKCDVCGGSNHPAGIHAETDKPFICQDCSGKEQMAEGKKNKKFDKIAHVSAISRNTIGQIKPKTIILSKKEKRPKYKEKFED